MDALESVRELARKNPDAARELVAVVRSAIEAAPKPKRLTWSQIWKRQQATWKGGE